MDGVQIFDWINTGGIPAAAALFIWGLFKGWIYWGKDVAKMEAAHEREEARLEQALELSQAEVKAHVATALTKLERLEKWAEERGAGHATPQ